MTTLLFDLSPENSKAFDPSRMVFGKPILYDDKGLLYPLKYRDGDTYCNIVFVFPKTRASYGLNTKAHLVDLTLGSKDNYMDNPLYQFLQSFDSRLKDMTMEKLKDVQYEDIVQFSKKRDSEGNLSENLEYGPHYTVGLQKRANNYILKVDGESDTGSSRWSYPIFDIEGMLSPGALVQVAATIGGLYVNEQKVGRVRPKIHTLKNCVNDIDISFQDQDQEFQEL